MGTRAEFGAHPPGRMADEGSARSRPTTGMRGRPNHRDGCRSGVPSARGFRAGRLDGSTCRGAGPQMTFVPGAGRTRVSMHRTIGPRGLGRNQTNRTGPPCRPRIKVPHHCGIVWAQIFGLASWRKERDGWTASRGRDGPSRPRAGRPRRPMPAQRHRGPAEASGESPLARRSCEWRYASHEEQFDRDVYRIDDGVVVEVPR